MKDGEMGVLEIKLDQGQVKASKLESVSGSEFIRLCSVRDVFAPRTIREFEPAHLVSSSCRDDLQSDLLRPAPRQCRPGPPSSWEDARDLQVKLT